VEVDHAGLQAHATVLQIHVQYLAHARHTDHERPFDRQRAAREAGARTSRDDRHRKLLRELHAPRDLGGRRGQNDERRPDPRPGQAVTLVNAQLGRVADAVLAADDLGEPPRHVHYFFFFFAASMRSISTLPITDWSSFAYPSSTDCCNT